LILPQLITGRYQGVNKILGVIDGKKKSVSISKTRRKEMRNKHKGSTFDSFLEDEGLIDKTEAVAVKRVIAFQIEKMMKKKHITKKKLANNMNTSRSALDRLLDPENAAVTLQSLVKAAHALGKKLSISFDKLND